MQIYKEIPIITAQPNKNDLQKVPHFLYGFAESDYNLSFGKWSQMLRTIVNEVQKRFEPIIIGGTMMYAYLLLKGYSQIPDVPDDVRISAQNLYKNIGHDEFLKIVEVKDKNTPKDKQRLIYNYCLLEVSGNSLEYYSNLPQIKFFNEGDVEVIIPRKTRQEVYQTCNSRFLDMISDGLLEEIEQVLPREELPIKRATGFPYVAKYLRGEISKEEMIEKSQQETRNYAKKQIIWLRKMAKEGFISGESIKDL